MRINLSSLRKNLNFQILILASLMPGLMMFPVSVQANPAGANVVYGNVNIQGLGTANLNIVSSSQNSIINWQSFSIQSGEVTNFQQPNAASVSLNRVVTGNPSALYGTLSSNGGVILINPNGIVVGEGGMVDVAGMMTMSTLDTTNEDFLNGGGMRFRGTNGKGIKNYGTITSSGGDVTLLGNFLQNSGTVSSSTGTVAFGAGGDIIVNQTASGGKISVLSGGSGGENSIVNDGTISGAAAELKAHGNVYALAIKNDGVVRANGYNFKGGRLTLSGGSRSSIMNTGTLSSRNADGSGGQVNITAGEVNLAGGIVDASGEPGMAGGSVAVNANKIDVADAATIDVGGSTAGSVDLNGGLSSTVNGSIQAVGNGGAGGSIDVAADVVSVGSSANINASGVDGAAGGQVRIGGGFQGNELDIKNSEITTVDEGALIFADSSGQDAGRVILWSDGDTMFRGDVSAQARGNVGNGGFVEVSGLRNLNYFGKVSTASVNGATGRLLLDPTDVVIGSQAGATISDTALVSAVLANNVVLHTASNGAAQGNITVQGGANVVYDSPNSLAFFAHGDIFINGDVKNHGTTDTPTTDINGAFQGTGNITLVAGWDGTGAAAFNFDPDAPAGANDGPVVTAADVLAGTYGAWGTNNGSVFLNDAGSEPVEVGSARGETNAFGHRIEMRAGLGNERFTQLGYRRENDARGAATMEFAEFNGTVAGVGADTGAFRVRANNAATTAITLTGDGSKTIDALVSDWNMANVGNELTVLSGGGERPDSLVDVLIDDTVNTGTDVNFFNGVTGNINAHANQDILLVPSTAISTSGEGIKTNDRAYVMIGHGGIRENDNGLESRGGTDYGSDSGHISVGNGFNSGNIVVDAGRALVITSNRAEAFTQIGHGGNGRVWTDGNVGNAVSHEFNPYTFYPGLGDVPELGLTGVGAGFILHPNQVGATTSNETRRAIWGNMTGNITVTAGLVDMEAGMYNAAHTQIGHGGERVRGSHSGDISVTTTTGGILMEAAPDSAIGGPANSNDWRWNQNRDQSYAQIGHGGFDSDYFDSFQLPRRNHVVLNTGEPARVLGPPITGGVDNTSIAGDGIRINPFSATGDAYGHSGAITVISAQGIEARAGNGTDAYAMFGHGGRSTHGDHKGDIKVEALNGDIIFDRDADQVNERGREITNRGDRAHVQIGHGGGRYQGGSTGEIDVDATGDIEFYGGRAESFAMIGHGGRGEDASTWSSGRQRNNQANGTHSGGISVISSGGSIKFRSGFSHSNYSFSQIGHGGYFQQADVVDVGQAAGNGSNFANDNGLLVGGGAATAADEGHNGDITVTAAGDISFKAGADDLREGQDWLETNSYDSWTMIGHGGRQSRGDHHGLITVEATGGDVEFEARGGWDAVAFRGSNTSLTPRLNSSDNNSRTGYRNWATIGHGGYDTEHTDASADNWNNSGKNGDGFGRGYDAAGALDDTAGTSTIRVTAGGDMSFTGAMEATAGPMLPILLFDDNTYDPPGNADASQRAINTGLDSTYISHEPIYVGNANGGLATTVVVAVDRTPATSGQVVFNDAGSTDMVILTGTGLPIDTVDALIAAHNLAADGSGNLPIIELRGGDGTQVLAAGARIVVTPYSTFDGMPAGTSAPVLLRANTLGADITVTGDGSTLGQLAAANGFTVVDGNAAEMIADGETFTISGGLDPRPAPSQQFSRHHGRHDTVIRANGEVWDLPDPVYSAEDSWASIGNGGRSSEYRAGIQGGGHRGDIIIDVTGNLSMLAGDIEQAVAGGQELPIRVRNFQNDVSGDAANASVGLGTVGGLGVYYVGPGIGGTDANHFENRGEQNDGTAGIRNYVQFGNGGNRSRGDHSGDITVTVGGDLMAVAGEGREDSVQIGHGGYDSDGSNDNNNRGGDTGNSGKIVITADGKITLLGGSRDNDVVGEPGTTAAAQGSADNSGYSYAQFGHGGAFVGGNHDGDIEVTAGTGIEMVAGSGRKNYTQIGHGANDGRSETLTGNITVVSTTGDITLDGVAPIIDTDTAREVLFDPFDELGLGTDNTAIAGNFNAGHISPGRESSVRIGHGGFDNDPQSGSGQNNGPGEGNFDGNITVAAVAGNVVVKGGGQAEFVAIDPLTGLTIPDPTPDPVTMMPVPGALTMIPATANTDYFRGQEAQIGHGGFATDGDFTGFVYVAAGQNISVTGGSASREAFGQIGHGGYSADGNHSGTIDLDAGLSVILERGDGQFNPWAKVGHGGQAFGGRNDNGTGTRGGDITISAGQDFMSTFGLVGHVDSRNDGDIFASEDGNTYIAVSRNDRFAGGTGRFVTDADTVITSGGFGTGPDSQLRLYMPDSGQNEIAEATQLNTTEYSRTVAPGSGRNDEQLAPEHAFATGAFNEVEGIFTPEGPYPTNSFGLYNIYYAGTAPPEAGAGAGGAGFVFNFLPFLYEDEFDAFDRQQGFLYFDGYDGQLYAVSLSDAEEDDSDPLAGGFFLEEMLDSNLGSRRDGNAAEGNDVLEGETDEELRRRKNFASRKVGRSGITYYTFSPGTNKYSSYRVFGVPEAGLGPVQ